MSGVFIIEVDSTEYGVQSPAIVGPFPSILVAEAFAERLGMGEAPQGGQGGYSAYHIVCDERAQAPEAYVAAYPWREAS